MTMTTHHWDRDIPLRVELALKRRELDAQLDRADAVWVRRQTARRAFARLNAKAKPCAV